MNLLTVIGDIVHIARLSLDNAYHKGFCDGVKAAREEVERNGIASQ